MRPPPLLPSSAIETSAPGTFDEARATSIYLFALRVLAILFEHHVSNNHVSSLKFLCRWIVVGVEGGL